MSSFTSSSEAAVAAVATAAGEAVHHHIRRLSFSSSSSSSDNKWYPFDNELDWRMAMFIFMVVVLVLGALVLDAIIRCCYKDQPDRQAPFQRTPEQILGRMSIEPPLDFTNGLTLAGRTDHPECTICLSEFVEGEGIRILSTCKHGFHVKCIETWLLKKSSCPTCRASCVRTSFNRNPPENQQQQQEQEQQQQQNDVDLEAANRSETEMVVLQEQQQQNDVDDIGAANPTETRMVVQQKQLQQSME